MSTRTPTRRTFTVSFPIKLAEQVERTAKAESRTTSELFREAFRHYRAQQVRKSLDEFRTMAGDNNHNGYGPEDVERLVDEVRAQRAAEKARKSAA